MAQSARRSKSDGISYLRSGREGGPPLVLVHGIGSNAQSFEPLMASLANGRDVIAWDGPGYGASDPLEMEWPSAGDYAASLSGFLDRLGIVRFDLLGHSLGALVAGRFAALHPDRVGRLVLSSPALGYGTTPGAPLAPGAAARLDGMLAEGAEAFAASRGPRLVHARHNASLVATVVKAMSEVRLPGYQQASRMLSCSDLLAEASRIKTPTLVMVGAQDEVTTPANCRRLYDSLSAASPALGHRFELVAEAGHAVAQEQPQAMARLIESFLPAVGN